MVNPLRLYSSAIKASVELSRLLKAYTIWDKLRCKTSLKLIFFDITASAEKFNL